MRAELFVIFTTQRGVRKFILTSNTLTPPVQVSQPDDISLFKSLGIEFFEALS